MFVLRYCVSVSVGILMVLANGVSITAQTVSNPEPTQTTEEPVPISGASLLSLENEQSVTGVKTNPLLPPKAKLFSHLLLTQLM
jgi:hypothetical protein